ncbi:hypothetical protein K502DRAFT_357619 [Neoconidiobolus thromboides FSU 785]|nr:hypothetical protein K502DRAFT_357619 [Neoconidiobolus thromboides FSU 785]
MSTESLNTVDLVKLEQNVYNKEETNWNYRLNKYFKTKKYHYTIIGIVFLDISLLAIGLVLVTYNQPETLFANKILFYISWVFPLIFFVEIFVKVYLVKGFKYYFDSWVKIADFVILTFSVVSDIALYVLLMEHAPATATAVIIFRLYKMFRLFHVFTHIQQMNVSLFIRINI